MSSSKRVRESSRTSSDDDGGQVMESIGHHGHKRPGRRPKRPKNEARSERKGERAGLTNASKSISGLTLEKDSEDDDEEEPILRRTRGEFANWTSSPGAGSSKRPNVAPTIDLTIPATTPTTQIFQPSPQIDPLTTKLDKIQNFVDSDDLAAAFRALTVITRTNAWQADPNLTLDSAIRVYNYAKLLGDGKKQGMGQARIINNERRQVMELKAEIKDLASEVARSRKEARNRG